MILILSKIEFEFLINSKILNEKMRDILNQSIGANGNKIKICFEDEELSNLYENLTEELIQVGFDKNYDVTKEGLIIEDLIDKLSEI